MVRALLWFRCAAVGDKVRPVQRAAARVGWEARERTVDLEIERGFLGEELLRRMKGWITVQPEIVITTVAQTGARLRVLDGRDLVVECRTPSEFEVLRVHLAEACGDAVELEAVKGVA